MPSRDFFKFFPATMLADDMTCMEGWFTDINEGFNPIMGARLLKSIGRFAFLMARAWGDLQKLINEKMLHFNTQGAPFSNDVAFYILHQIANGMKALHERDIIHQDMKAANVLVFGTLLENPPQQVFEFDPMDLRPYEFDFKVDDSECSIGIVETGFWRAPEILEAVKNRNTFQKPELFTKQTNVYSFGTTCYDILSCGLPLEELGAKDYDTVIGGARPILPSQTTPWMVDLVNRCWHKDPSMTPSFEEIVEILEPYIRRSCKKKNIS